MAEVRLIDADAFVADIKTEIMNLRLDGLKGTPRPTGELYDIIDRIGEQPTVNPDSLRPKGRWLQSAPGYRLCSHCQADVAIYSGHRNFCPNCGADMRE